MLSSQLCFNNSLSLSLSPFYALYNYSLSFSESKLRKKRKMEQEELDLRNPLTVSHDLQYDGVSSLFANESDHMPRLLSFDSFELRLSIRRTALSLISQVNSTFQSLNFLRTE